MEGDSPSFCFKPTGLFLMTALHHSTVSNWHQRKEMNEQVHRVEASSPGMTIEWCHQGPLAEVSEVQQWDSGQGRRRSGWDWETVHCWLNASSQLVSPSRRGTPCPWTQVLSGQLNSHLRAFSGKAHLQVSFSSWGILEGTYCTLD